LTDSDDIAAEIREGAPLQALPPDGDTLAIPNTLAVVADAPHPDAAQMLWQYLQQTNVTQTLVSAQALEGLSLHGHGSVGLKPDWDKLLLDLEPATAILQRIFLR
jgi:iron(III) transport system substrate-binding protein